MRQGKGHGAKAEEKLEYRKKGKQKERPGWQGQSDAARDADASLWWIMGWG
jgi:hypothetical protein